MKYLVAGLGNMGIEYARTRHNIGFIVLDALARDAGISFSTERYADKAILKHRGNPHLSHAGDIPPWCDEGSETADPALISQDMSYIRHIMWNYVGLVRNPQRLKRAIRELRSLEVEIEHFYRITRISENLIGLRNLIRNAIIVTFAAWENKENTGFHFRG